MYSKMTAAAENAQELIQARGKWPKEFYKKEARITESLSEEQHEELLTMTGAPQTA